MSAPQPPSHEPDERPAAAGQQPDPQPGSQSDPGADPQSGPQPDPGADPQSDPRRQPPGQPAGVSPWQPRQPSAGPRQPPSPPVAGGPAAGTPPYPAAGRGRPATPHGSPATPPEPPARPSGQPVQPRIPAQRASGALTPPPATQPPGATQPPPARRPGPALPGPAQPTTAQPGPAQPTTAQPGPAQPRAAQPGAAPPPAARPGASRGAPQIPPAAQPPTARPFVAQPPTARPPAAQPPTAQPPAAQPPTAQPFVAQPPAAQPSPAAAQAQPFVAQPASTAQPAATYTVPAVVAPWQQQGTTAARTTATGTTATGTTAGAAAAAGAAQAPSFPSAAAAPDDGPPRGTVLRSQHALRDARRRALSHRLTALHTGWHVVTAGTLRRMTGTSPGTGLILGVDQQRQPILVRLFRPTPTKVTLVGGVWAQRMLAFRALALGARVVLITTDPGAWHGFGELATGRSDRVALWHHPHPPVVPATAQQPALIIADTGAYGGAPLPEPRPWQTQLVVVRQLGADNVRALQDCNLVITQRLAAGEASVAVQALNLTEQSIQLLQLMGEDMLALIDGDTRYVWLSPTAVERQYNGAPRR